MMTYSERPAHRHFSLVRNLHLSDLLTLGNGFAGAAAVLLLVSYAAAPDPRRLWAAMALFPLSLAFDFLDGRVARARGKVSALGQELDSLADLVSFVVAPAALGFAAGLRGGWDAAALVFFVGCGIARLARYNATAASLSDAAGKVRYFEGVPVTGSALLVGTLAAAAVAGRLGAALPLGGHAVGPFVLHPLAMGYAAVGAAMISKTLRVPKP
jgi:CDP-diacylglycerol--serine O-phosphatidyltransferase